VALSNQPVSVELSIVFVADTDALARADVKGKAVAMPVAPVPTQPLSQFTIRGNFQATTATMLRQHAARIAQAGGAAAILISDGSRALDEAFIATATLSSRGTYAIDSVGGPAGTFARPPNQNAGPGRGRGNAVAIPSVWVRHDLLDVARSANAKLAANIAS